MQGRIHEQERVISARELAHMAENDELENEKIKMQDMKRQYALIDRVFQIFGNAKIIAKEKNKQGEELLVVEERRGSSLDVYLVGGSYSNVSLLPRIMGTVYINPHLEQNYIIIEDIIMVRNNVGNGQIAMKHYLKVAESLGVEYIKGWLSPVDRDHFDRSEHYYKKFAFEVIFDENRTSGAIKKIIMR